MSHAVVFVRPAGDTGCLESDPFIRQIGADIVEVFEAEAGFDREDLERRVLATIRALVAEDVSVYVVIGAFLDLDTPGFRTPTMWRPSQVELERLTSCLYGGGDAVSLTSLSLMWALWRRVRQQVQFFVSLNGVQMSGEARVALEMAFSAGRACEMYDWETYERGWAAKPARIAGAK